MELTPDPMPSLPELARKWGWHQDKLRRLVARNKIPHLRIGGRIYFEWSAVERWKAAARRATVVRGEDTSRRRSPQEECQALGIPEQHEYQ